MHLAKAAPAEFKMGNTPAASAEPTSLRPFFTQWVHSTGVPEFNIEYVIYRTKKGFRIVGKAKQNLDVFHMDVEIESADGRKSGIQDDYDFRKRIAVYRGNVRQAEAGWNHP